MHEKRKNILLISPEGWGANYVSKHHYAICLSKEHNVWFLNPPVGYAALPLGGDMDIKQEEIGISLRTITYRNLLPKLNRFPIFVQRFIYRKQAKKLLSHMGEVPDMVWSFDPSRFFDQSVWGAPERLYFSFDYHQNRLYEKLICRQSDHIYTAARGLKELLEKEFDVSVLNLGHGFSEPASMTSRIILPGNNQIKILYTGNISQFIDLEYFEQLFEKFSGADFIMIGPVDASFNLGGTRDLKEYVVKLQQKYPNVFFPGVISPEDLFSYTSQADLLLFYHIRPVYNSHKLMLYFFSGAITLATPVLEFDPESFLMIQAGTNEEYIEKLAFILENLETLNSEEQREMRRRFALENRYSQKLSCIFSNVGIRKKEAVESSLDINDIRNTGDL